MENRIATGGSTLAQKLELTWIGKGEQPKLEPRILLEDPELSYHAKERVTENDIFDNRLIFGDNLLALKALEQEFTGKIKCIYIDPPYNTGNAFEHYDDGLEHSIWLSLMKARLEIIRNLISEDGSLWISIDDDEAHYLKVLCDEIFGRRNFISSIIWQKKFSPSNDAKFISDSHDYILVYAKNKDLWKRNLLPRTTESNSRYKNPDNDPRGPWTSGDLSVKTYSEEYDYPITTPSGRVVYPPKGSCWRIPKSKFEELVKDNRIWFGEKGNNVPRLKRFLSEVQEGIVPKTLWLRDEVGDNQEAKREVKKFNEQNVFATPKPERLIQRILQIATNEGDWVLDSFAGSGTTGAVAHKMGRRWIMIELGEHCHTHIIPRMKRVIDGTDQGGISKAVNWQGGGGFRYYKLAPSLLKKDKFGNWIINPEYNAEMLAEAMCKHEGFTYNPDPHVFWKQGQSTENDFIFTTTQLVTHQMVAGIVEQMKENETLLICCKAYNVNVDEFPQITIKKLPQAILNKCEFGRDDYSLNVNNLPMKEREPEQLELF
ncbi:site-specific DNA-methyltransferase [Anoxybacillus sp. LAT_35]|uniref:site-specific DNA-methyltransferase n=1 Tax=unclassified Anoxybacillus TaxID=2639704 RepID=UPI001EDB5CBC|nr:MULTISPECIES: site-specific DNA-methyltransferase [unclassified Anoxybacillus]MCG5025722.1 site-specific DNA-methyltransferase [Anoxybacillus flavithermus]MCG6196061.1 site-specific DNA-methyltransferase [Anoxybacillus sp. LAT_38]MCG3084075.1 site-specific DNA-methyltransferase [Anoxybacillus sp. LAT27]MCG6170622.1 site-specific DNA-methyltransferase [Anoxybacillus sp. LAT_11]MCG6174763.1 site-specific DNA-methyltransferase [Anoxybacillus sp. LAT_31]